VPPYTIHDSERKRDIPRFVPVMAGGVCTGFLISCGPRGVEAFDRAEKSLGIFPSVIEAAAAVEKSTAPACLKCGDQS
jgi:hypothetical protein